MNDHDLYGPKTLRQQAEENEDFRRVLHTGSEMQVVLMNIDMGDDIGMEVHADSDQVLIQVSGEGRLILGDSEMPFEENDVVIVPAGTQHNLINSGDEPLQIITIYSLPQHAEGTVHETKEDALAEKGEEHEEDT
jgi:mannose-6-phosphate isomerase-like protein (cupin superfamily)